METIETELSKMAENVESIEGETERTALDGALARIPGLVASQVEYLQVVAGEASYGSYAAELPVSAAIEEAGRQVAAAFAAAAEMARGIEEKKKVLL